MPATLLLLAFPFLALIALAWWITSLLLYPPPQPLDRDPSACGLDYEAVSFTSSDGLTLRGWWIPAGIAAPAIILLHPLFGNRLGCRPRSQPWACRLEPQLDLLAVAHRFHQAGYAVLLFDFRHHGQSLSGCCAGGLNEDQDVAAAVDFVFNRLQTESPRVGLVGFGLGASAAIAAVGREKGGGEAIRVFSADSESATRWTEFQPPTVKKLRFVVAVQPGSLRAWLRQSLPPVLTPLLLPLVSRLFLARSGYPLDGTLLLKAAPHINMPVLYVASAADVAGEVPPLYAATPEPKQIWCIDAGPLEAGAYACAHLERVVAFAAEF